MVSTVNSMIFYDLSKLGNHTFEIPLHIPGYCDSPGILSGEVMKYAETSNINFSVVVQSQYKQSVMVGWRGNSPAPLPQWLVRWLKRDRNEPCILPKVEHSSTNKCSESRRIPSGLKTKCSH